MASTAEMLSRRSLSGRFENVVISASGGSIELMVNRIITIRRVGPWGPDGQARRPLAPFTQRVIDRLPARTRQICSAADRLPANDLRDTATTFVGGVPRDRRCV